MAPNGGAKGWRLRPHLLVSGASISLASALWPRHRTHRLRRRKRSASKRPVWPFEREFGITTLPWAFNQTPPLKLADVPYGQTDTVQRSAGRARSHIDRYPKRQPAVGSFISCSFGDRL